MRTTVGMKRIVARAVVPALALLWTTLMPGMTLAEPDTPLRDDLVRVRPVGIVRLAGSIVPRAHDWRRPLDAEVWTERGREAIYHPGESVEIRFRTSADAYVCIYDIDTEGRLRILFPTHPGDDGFVPGGRVMTLPSPDADYDFIASGPPGIELLEIVASRYPLRSPWSDDAAVHGTSHQDNRSVSGYWDEEDGTDWERWAEPVEWSELDELDAYGADAADDAYAVDGEISAYAESGMDLHAGWTVHGLLITGDPFVAIQRVNRRLLPHDHIDGDYATDYVTLHIARRHRFPRYLCGDCHGRWHPHDPYRDACAVFTVRINTGWRYPGRHVRTHPRRWGPRYIYVRHERVPHRYRTLKRHWPSHERHQLRHQFRGERPRGDAYRTPKSTQIWPKRQRRKTTDGYDWKTLESRGRSMQGERSRGSSSGSRRSSGTMTQPRRHRSDSMKRPSGATQRSPRTKKQFSNWKKNPSDSEKRSSSSKTKASSSKKKSSGAKSKSSGAKSKSSGSKSKSSGSKSKSSSTY